MTGPSRRVLTCPDAEGAAAAAADIFLELFTDRFRVRREGAFTVSLSGGRTPRRAYELLSAEPYASDIDWVRVDVFFGDERCVPPGHKDSNYGMAQEALLGRVPARVHRIRGEDDPRAAAAAYEAEVLAVLGEGLSFDLVFLGLGEDGHTASLFPGSDALLEEGRLVREVERAGAYRVTMTLPLLNRARCVVFLVTGEEKRAVLGEVLGGVGNHPASRIRPARGEVVWVVDRAAAGRG